MKKATYILISFTLALVLLSAQVLTVFAAPNSVHSIAGQVTYIEVVPDETTGITTVLVTIDNEQTVRISVETAERLKLIYNNGEEYVIVEPLPDSIELNAKDIIVDEPLHPVGSALVTFFADIDGLTYDMVMEAHKENGFGVIAQALWMTRKLAEENAELMLTQESLTESDIFLTILAARNDGDYSVFFPDQESVPTNWGQFKKAILAGEIKTNLGAVMSHHNGNTGNPAQTNAGNGNQDKQNKQDKKDKPDHPNNGNGRGPR